MNTASSSLPSAADVLNWQLEQIRTNNYEPIGRAWIIVLEASKGAAVPGASVANSLGSRLEFYNYMPRIGQTRDRSTLLLLDPIRRPDGSVGLPDIPDPGWIPPVPTEKQVQGLEPGYTPPQAPMIRQELADRARGVLKGTDYIVFGPVVQVLIRPEGIPEGWIASCGQSIGAPGTKGTEMELLVDRTNGQALFFGGRYQISRAG